MATPSWNSVRARQEMGRLTAPGVLGFYTHFEATELFAVPAGQTAPTNVLTVLVAEERLPEAAAEPVLLNSQRIKPRHLKGWIFGIKRYVKPIVELIPAFDQLSDSKKWRLSGELLGTGDLVPVPTQFVPPDATGTAPLNRVLKNNFWNGSHLFEWADPIKAPFSAVFRNPPALQELSDAIRPFVPIGIAGLSDRLGNIIVQLPVTVLIAKFGQRRTSGDFTVAIGWHPKAAPRPLRATCQKEYDNTISDFMSANTDASETLLPLQSGQGLHRGLVYDDQNQVLLAASGDLGFISSVALRILPVGIADPRIFTVRDDTGVPEEVRIGLLPDAIESVVGEPESNPAGDWTDRRIYREEASRLERELRFKQYEPKPGRQCAEHEVALTDLRTLISQHGRTGVWLWDPYLSADDVLATLFYCPFSGADLRALSSGHIVPAEVQPQHEEAACATLQTSPPPVVTFAESQRAILQGANSNLLGLRLEYRVKTGLAGWAFHDRFLIFPGHERGALAWSLGTSVNSLGSQHHILQQVSDGQLVSDAFAELWDQLDQPEHLVWKVP
jgi:hypothetical protein